jgi:hypothetical protein
LSGYYFTENERAKELGFNNNKVQIGLRAQEVQKVLPELVSLAPVDMVTDEEGNTVSKSGNNYLTVNYNKLVPVLVEAIKQLTDRVNYLESKLNT